MLRGKVVDFSEDWIGIFRWYCSSYLREVWVGRLVLLRVERCVVWGNGIGVILFFRGIIFWVIRRCLLLSLGIWVYGVW